MARQHRHRDGRRAARAQALISVSFSAVYPPARILAARVALLGDRLDDALKATEDLEASSPDVAIVRAAAAYERIDADGLALALEAVPPEGRKLPVLLPVVIAQEALIGRARLPKEKLLSLAGSDAPWGDLVAMDIALDFGDLETAKAIGATWKTPEKLPLRALRLSRLARYEGRLEDAEKLSEASMRGGTVSPRTLQERALVLVAQGKASDVAPVLAKYPLVLGPLGTWLGAYALASTGKTEEARGRTAAVEPPPSLAPLPARMIAAMALGAMKDKNRGFQYVKSIFDLGVGNPDMATAGTPWGMPHRHREGSAPGTRPGGLLPRRAVGRRRPEARISAAHLGGGGGCATGTRPRASCGAPRARWSVTHGLLERDDAARYSA